MVTSEIFPIREDAKSREGAELLMTRGAVVNKKKLSFLLQLLTRKYLNKE